MKAPLTFETAGKVCDSCAFRCGRTIASIAEDAEGLIYLAHVRDESARAGHFQEAVKVYLADPDVAKRLEEALANPPKPPEKTKRGDIAWSPDPRDPEYQDFQGTPEKLKNYRFGMKK